MSLRSILLPLFLVAYSLVFSQSSEYNLPPGYKLNPNHKTFDLSYKLNGADYERDLPEGKLRILKDIPDSRLNETSSEYQQYVKEGKKFINSLSKKIRGLYTEEELWYIYAFDSKLKNQIKNIK